MKKSRFLVILGLFLGSIVPSGVSKGPRSMHKNLDIVIFDTTHRTQALYEPFIVLAESVGFAITYMPLDRIFDESNLVAALSSKQGIVFVFGLEFLQGMQQGSALSAKVLDFMEVFCQLPDKFVGLIFPPFMGASTERNRSSLSLVRALAPIFTKLGITVPAFPLHAAAARKGEGTVSKREKSAHTFLAEVNNYLATPIESRLLLYHTTLREPSAGTVVTSKLTHKVGGSHGDLVMLPTLQLTDYSSTLKSMMPFGIGWFNQFARNMVWVSSSTLFSLGIKENFKFFPTQDEVKKEIYKGMQQMMWELHALMTCKGKQPKKMVRFTERLPESLIAFKSTPLSMQHSKIKKTAWMEINLFQQKAYDHKLSGEAIARDKTLHAKKQHLLVDYILKSGLDTLWISFAPNMFYSPIARERQKEKTFLDSISLFTTMLQNASRTHGVAIPKILVGFEVTNNVYAPNLPKTCATDLYGNQYEDLPTPLDANFWENEVKKPLELFVEQWKNPAISNGIPLSGVVLDLEMYCRKKSSLFLSTMGFEVPTFQRFAQKFSLNAAPTSAHDITSFLMHEKRGKQYFDFLEQEADNLGNDLRSFFTQKIPDCLIACYAPSLLVEWFYKGLWKGLSSQKNPLHLYTFNTEFKHYQPWFKQQGIYANHSSVLLLSKIKKTRDFKWVDDVLKQHDGVWLNRFSRLVEDYDSTSWIHVEQTPLEDNQKAQFMKYLRNAR